VMVVAGVGFEPTQAKLTAFTDRWPCRALLDAGKVTPVINRTYPLTETAEAIRYLETGYARGKVVITV